MRIALGEDMTNETINVGDKVNFPRGMFGVWAGKVRKLYQSKGAFAVPIGTPMALVSYQRKNGSFGRARVRVDVLTRSA